MPHELGLDPGARRDPDPRDLRAKQREVQQRERADEGRVSREPRELGRAGRRQPQAGLEREDPHDDEDARQRPRKGGHQGHQNVERRRQPPAQPPVEAHERRLDPDRQERADLEVEQQPRVARLAKLAPHSTGEQKRPDGERRALPDPELGGRSAEDHVRAEPERCEEAMPPSSERAQGNKPADERFHPMM